MNKQQIPNLLTIFRILSVPLIAGLIAISGHSTLWLALILYIFAAISDFLDGYLARKWHVESAFGRMLDPIADKLLVGVLLVALITTPIYSGIHSYGVMLILFREIFISGLREGLAGKLVIHVSFLAKIKTTLQLIAVGFALAGLLDILPVFIAQFALWLATFLTIYTGIEYFIQSLKFINK